MTKPLIHFSSLLDRAAFEHLQNKTLLPSFSHYDVWLYEHSVGFTVAKMMDMDLLAETKSAVVSALENGTDFRDFKNRLKPYLMAKGWWGEQVMLDPVDGVAKTVQLGSTRRLRVIFQTNLATAYAAGQWARIQENKQMFPYLKYIASTAEHKRQSHMTYYGKIWAADDPIWQSIFPPNGYGCQCTVRQLTKKQALRERNEDINRQPERFNVLPNSKKSMPKTVCLMMARTIFSGWILPIRAQVKPSKFRLMLRRLLHTIMLHVWQMCKHSPSKGMARVLSVNWLIL